MVGMKSQFLQITAKVVISSLCPSLARKFRHSSEAILIAGPCPAWCRIPGTWSPPPPQDLPARGRPHPGLPIPCANELGPSPSPGLGSGVTVLTRPGSAVLGRHARERSN